MRLAADDEITKWKFVSAHYKDLDGKLQVLYGCHVDFQKQAGSRGLEVRPQEDLEDGPRVEQRSKESSWDVLASDGKASLDDVENCPN